jgi:hypothetical protein
VGQAILPAAAFQAAFIVEQAILPAAAFQAALIVGQAILPAAAFQAAFVAHASACCVEISGVRIRSGHLDISFEARP